VSSC
jgi:hypothetical protein